MTLATIGETGSMCLAAEPKPCAVLPLIQPKLFEAAPALIGMKARKPGVDEIGAPKKRKCANGKCRREIHTGDDALALQRVVMGVQRAVPLEEARLFHTDKCFHEYVCNSDEISLPKRIP
jgi:hypothetical protein